MKAKIELVFRDENVYGKNQNEEISDEEYNKLSSLVDTTVYEAFSRILGDVVDELGINDFEIYNITYDGDPSFSYVLSTGFPQNSAVKAFDMFDCELRTLLSQYTGYAGEYGLKRLAWREFSDGSEIECPHEYETVHFIAVQNDVREIKTCKHCKNSIAKLVKLVDED